jgi:hypothetical protein
VEQLWKATKYRYHYFVAAIQLFRFFLGRLIVEVVERGRPETYALRAFE